MSEMFNMSVVNLAIFLVVKLLWIYLIQVFETAFPSYEHSGLSFNLIYFPVNVIRYIFTLHSYSANYNSRFSLHGAEKKRILLVYVKANDHWIQANYMNVKEKE